ncbi:transporter substrate-binding domain-containing protein [Cellvibrio sp. OA-2007]|uniref:transporter substrate-binding domain-containing protein n=1 Tax=Cellvibrio sp. OA-2007 TaxID=529823 RepID=UPI000A0618EC|nr:transporter substrate-binding domain-containing protein [Cellvibrio sp. OA-2007]
MWIKPKLRQILLYGALALIAATTQPLAAATKTVTTNMKSNVQTDYMNGLLKLALSYSDKSYVFSTTSEVYSRPRVMESVKSGEISVMWGGTSDEMERDFIPIRIDAYRGLMNHRLFFIRQGDQARFDNIKTLEDLKQIRFGQGRSWQDASILESAGLTVVKTTKKPGLYHMLDGGRFDAFPRGANEVWTELSAFPELKLTVEKNLVLIYPLPTYFFVSHKDPELAKDIEHGLEAAIKDGAFNKYFYGSPEVQEALGKADLGNRRAIRIDNPYLPKATPLDRKELWLDLTATASTADISISSNDKSLPIPE